MAKSILVISDIRETEHCALNKAHDIAAPLGEQIDVVRFIKPGASTDTAQPELDRQYLELQNKDLKASIDEIFIDYENKESITYQVVATEDIVPWVIEYCKSRDFDLVLKAGHRSETLFHTPCDWELIRSLQTPVLIASQKHWQNKPTVLAALNAKSKDQEHQELNNNILEWTKKWATTFDCNIHLVYCLPVSNFLRELDIIDVKEYARTHRSEGEELLQDLIKDHDLPNVKMHVTAGSAARAIPHCANELKAELVIMGCSGRTGLKSVLMGNVAEKVMHHLRTDSLVIEIKNSISIDI